MCIRYFAVVLLASLAMGQAAPNSTTPPPKSSASHGPAAGAKANESEVAPDAPVITVPGICHSSSSHVKAAAPASKEDCKTVITRAQFEALANALQPNMNAQTKRRLAEVYPRLLVMAQEARKRGLEDKPA